GNLLQTGCLNGESYINIQAKLKKKYGDIYQYWLGPYRYYVFNNAEHAQHVFNHKHIYDLPSAPYRKHARIILPIFRKANVVQHLNIIIDCTDKLIHLWRNQNEQQENKLNTNIIQQSKNLLLDIISLVAFHYDLEAIEGNNQHYDSEELINAMNIFTDAYAWCTF
ncbi:unnamed protein product, partial [Didymodactylos carnosus]